MADQVQFAINIAAGMVGAEQTVAQLDDVSAKLMGAGKGADFFRDAIEQVSAELKAAQASSTAANAALADGASEFRLLEKAAIQAQKALEKATLSDKTDATTLADLRVKAQAADAALANFGATMRKLEGDQQAAAKASTFTAAKLENLKKISANVDKSLAGQSETLSKWQGGLSAIGGPIGRLGQLVIAPAKGFADLSQSMGAANATMLATVAVSAAVVVGIAAITAAVIAGVVAVTSWAISLADAQRSAALTRYAVEQVHPELAAMRSELLAISDATGQTEESLRGLADQLTSAKVAGGDLPVALRAAALAEAALGKGGASKFIEQIKAGKLSISKFAAEAQAKFGGVVARQLLGLEAQAIRFKKNISGLFGSLDIESALGGLQTLIGLFDATTAAGRAVQFYFEKMFQPLISGAQNAAYVIEAFVLGALIGLTKLYIAAKPALKFISELLGFGDVELETVLNGAAKAGEYIVKAVVAVGAVVAAVLGPILAIVGVLVAWNAALMSLVGVVIYFAGVLVAKVIGAVTSVVDYFKNVSWEQLGYDAITALVGGILAVSQAVYTAAAAVANAIWSTLDSALAKLFTTDWGAIGVNIAKGIASGIASGAIAVWDAVTGMAKGALSAAKKALGIASPSKEMAVVGGFTAEGFTSSVEDATPAAQSALADMVEPPVPALSRVDALSGNLGAAPVTSAPATSAPVTPAGPSTSLNLAGANFNFYGVKDADQAEGRFGELLTRLLEGDVTSLGGEVAA